jgi:hypothetical protein
MLLMPLPQDRSPVAEVPPVPPQPSPPPDPPRAEPEPDPAAEIFRITGKWIWDFGTPL